MVFNLALGLDGLEDKDATDARGKKCATETGFSHPGQLLYQIYNDHAKVRQSRSFIDRLALSHKLEVRS